MTTGRRGFDSPGGHNKESFFEAMVFFDILTQTDII